jgi:hypothetical protein
VPVISWDQGELVMLWTIREVRSACSLAALVALFPSVAGAQPAPQPTGQLITIPAGLVIELHVTKDVSSADVKVGDNVPMQAVSDVAVGGYLIVRAGAEALGTVATVSPAAAGGHAGSITLQYVYVRAVDGEKIRIVANQTDALAYQNQTPQQTNGTTQLLMNGATQAISAVGGGGIANTVSTVGSLLMQTQKGKEQTIATTTSLLAYVAGTVHVVSNVRASVSPADDYAH